ncbi:MAG: serine protease [Burkholderiaceae bacterium]|jgi:hypothetical protein|nr:serine protease [Burkholderiaceae bacterium]
MTIRVVSQLLQYGAAAGLALALVACGGGDGGSDGAGGDNTGNNTTDTTGGGGDTTAGGDTTGNNGGDAGAGNVSGEVCLAQSGARPKTRQLGALEPGDGSATPQSAQIKILSQSDRQRVPPHVIVMPALTRTKAAALPALALGQPQQIGVARALAETADAQAMAGLLSWASQADGRRTAISVRAPGAEGLRLGLRVDQLPPGTQLRVYAPGSAQTIEIAGEQVLRVIQLNRDAGVSGAEADTYWLPTVVGAEAALEIELPADTDPSQLKVSLPRVSHLTQHPADNVAVAKAASACNIDTMCAPESEIQMHAVAQMNFMKDGGSYSCTGTLLNNTQRNRIPYFLSANHCIPNQAVASTLETWWNFRSASCGSTQLDRNSQQIAGGAELLYNSVSTDTAFMRLNSAPAANAIFAGWNAGAGPSLQANIFSIHHPDGDWQKYSAGVIESVGTCTRANSGEGTVLCREGAANDSSPFYRIRWSRGITESGSSGGALFNTDGQVIGQLYAGPANCVSRQETDSFGRLDLAFDAALSHWLSPDCGDTGQAPR